MDSNILGSGEQTRGSSEIFSWTRSEPLSARQRLLDSFISLVTLCLNSNLKFSNFMAHFNTLSISTTGGESGAALECLLWICANYIASAAPQASHFFYKHLQHARGYSFVFLTTSIFFLFIFLDFKIFRPDP